MHARNREVKVKPFSQSCIPARPGGRLITLSTEARKGDRYLKQPGNVPLQTPTPMLHAARLTLLSADHVQCLLQARIPMLPAGLQRSLPKGLRPELPRARVRKPQPEGHLLLLLKELLPDLRRAKGLKPLPGALLPQILKGLFPDLHRVRGGWNPQGHPDNQNRV
jgi:hypothetical protein